MDVFQARDELRRMGMKDLLRLASRQKISECLVGGRACGLYVCYKEFHFCISELLRKGCIYETSEKLKTKTDIKEGDKPLLPWHQTTIHRFLRLERKGIPFKVFWRDEINRTMILLGETIERRREERDNNLRDLLIKARTEFSDQVPNPASIFLLGP